MSAPKGNKFWLARSSHGRKPIFENPEQLWNACCEYFEWVEDNPLFEEKLFHAAGVITKDIAYHPRPMTMGGLCIFLDIADSTWQEYRKKDDFSAICANVDKIIYHQKFAGATAGLMNAAIIARDLGLKDKQEVEQSGSVSHNHSHEVKSVDKFADILKDYDQQDE